MFVPALAGLGAPFWAPEARGAWLGLSLASARGTSYSRSCGASPRRCAVWQRRSPATPVWRRRACGSTAGSRARRADAGAGGPAAGAGRVLPVARRDGPRRGGARHGWGPARRAAPSRPSAAGRRRPCTSRAWGAGGPRAPERWRAARAVAVAQLDGVSAERGAGAPRRRDRRAPAWWEARSPASCRSSTLRLRAAGGRQRRRSRHQQGEHGAAAHGLRRQAGNARGAPRAPRSRAAERLRPARRDPARAGGRAAGGVERGGARALPGDRRAGPRQRLRRDRRDPAPRSCTAASRARPGARAALGGARRGHRVRLHHPAGVRHRGGARGLRAATATAAWTPSERPRGGLRAGHLRRTVAAGPLPGQRRRPVQRRARPHARPRRLHRHAAARAS